jgi:hypothetical protein
MVRIPELFRHIMYEMEIVPGIVVMLNRDQGGRFGNLVLNQL